MYIIRLYLHYLSKYITSTYEYWIDYIHNYSILLIGVSRHRNARSLTFTFILTLVVDIRV